MEIMYEWKCVTRWMKVIDIAQTWYLKEKFAFIQQEDQVKSLLLWKNYWKFLLISFLVTDRGLVEILNLHRKWKSEKTKNIVLFLNRLQRELCFSKCKSSLCLAYSEFRPQEIRKNCQQKFSKNIIFLLVFMQIAYFKLHSRSEYDRNVNTKCL